MYIIRFVNSLPKNPANVRTVIRVSILGANADGICSNEKTVKHIKYSFLRPNVSDKGASTIGPIPSRITYPVVAPMTLSDVVSKESAI